MPETILLIDYENVKDSGLDQLPPHDRAMLLVGRNQKLKLPFIQKQLSAGTRLDLVQVAEQGRNNLDFYIAHYLGVEIAANPAAAFIVFSNDTDLDHLLEHLAKQRHINCKRVGLQSKVKQAARQRTPAKLVPAKAPVKSREKKPVEKPAPVRAIAKPLPVIPEREMAKVAPRPQRQTGGHSVKGASPMASRNDNARAAAPMKDADYIAAVNFLKNSKRRQPKNLRALLNSLASHLQMIDRPADVHRIVDALVARGVIAITANRVTYKA